MIAADLATALDPCLLADRAGYGGLDAWQRDCLRNGAPRILLNVCRQGGKSTVAGLLAVHTALYQADSLCLLLSPSLRQSQLAI